MDARLDDARVIDAPLDAWRDAASDGAMGDAGADAGEPMLACHTTTCDPRSGEGCAASETCVLADRSPSCADVAGLVEEGGACAAAADCAEGLSCFDSRLGPLCARICCPGDDTCGTELRCAPLQDLVDGTRSGWGRCVGPRMCDVLHPDLVCEPGEGCYIVSPEADTDCRTAGTGDVGDPCERQQDCAGGLFCGGVTSRMCVRICSLDGRRVPCPDGEGECRAYSQSPEGTGLCTPI